MYMYKVVQLGINGSREVLEEIAPTSSLTLHEMEEFAEDRQVHWMRYLSNLDRNVIKLERRLIPLK